MFRKAEGNRNANFGSYDFVYFPPATTSITNLNVIRSFLGRKLRILTKIRKHNLKTTTGLLTSIKLEPSWMSNVSTGGLELCFLAGNAPSILPAMLGGSAPSQVPGAPLRTENENRTSVWPPPAHQSNLFNRGYGIYSLFPGPGDHGKTLFTPDSRTPHESPFPGFLGNEKDTLFQSKFSYSPSGFHSPSHKNIEPDISHLNLMAKPFNQIVNTYTSVVKQPETIDGTKRGDSNLKNHADDALIIKSEIDETNTIPDAEVEHNGGNRGRRERGDIEIEKSDNFGSGSESTSAEGVLADEPDSTESREISEKQKVTDVDPSKLSLKIDAEKNSNSFDFEIDENATEKDGRSEKVSKDGATENNVSPKEKCNIKVIDLSIEQNEKRHKEKKAEVCGDPVKNMGDIAKIPDSSLKSSVANSRQFPNEMAKFSPSRTMSLPSSNGGCSRTTPVTFKTLSHQETDGRAEVYSRTIKKEPSDYQKYRSSAPFIGFTSLENLFSPNAMGTLDEQLLNPVPYSSSYRSSNGRKEDFLCSSSNDSVRINHGFPNLTTSLDNAYLSPKLDRGELNNYKSCLSRPKLMEDYMINIELPKTPEEMLGRAQSVTCLNNNGEGGSHDGGTLVNSTTSEIETKSVSSIDISCSSVNVTPCQVAEVTSASALLSPKIPAVVKQEATTLSSAENKKEDIFVSSGQSTAVSSTVGAPLKKQVCQQRQNDNSLSLNNASPGSALHRSPQSPTAVDLPAMRAAVYAGALACNERPAALWPTQPHSPALWQYSAPIDYPPFPPVGLQLVRDPITGHFLLIPASNLEALQRAWSLWPSYQPPHPQIIPPISLQPSTSHLLLDTNVSPVNFLSSESLPCRTPPRRILITDDLTKNKVIGSTLIKHEASDISSPAVETTCETGSTYDKSQFKTIPGSGNNFPLIPSQLVKDVQTQATSAVPSLNQVFQDSLGRPSSAESGYLQSFALSNAPTLNTRQIQTDESVAITNQRSQTSIAAENEIENLYNPIKENIGEIQEMKIKKPEDDKPQVAQKIQNQRLMKESSNVEILNVPIIDIKKEISSPPQVDVSGLELLSNSIEQFACKVRSRGCDEDSKEILRNCMMEEVERRDLSNDTCEGAVLLQNLKNGFREVNLNSSFESQKEQGLGGLGLLCALAEQRFQEEIKNNVCPKTEVEISDEQTLKMKEEIGKRSDGCDEKEKDVEDENSRINEFLGKENEKGDEGKEENDNDDDDSSNNKNEELSAKTFFYDETKVCDYNRNKYEYFPELNRKSDIFGSKTLTQPSRSKQASPFHMNDCENVIFNGFQGSINAVPKRGRGRPKKVKCDLNSQDSAQRLSDHESKERSPPVLEKQTDYFFNNETTQLGSSCTMKSPVDASKPPTLTPSAIFDDYETDSKPPTLSLCEINIVRSSDKSLTNGGSCTSIECETKKRKSEKSDESPLKKRKVGRPKKHLTNFSNSNEQTEVIVLKKSKMKFSLPKDSTSEKSQDNLFEKEEWSGDPRSRKNSLDKTEEDSIESLSCFDNIDQKKPKKIRPKLKAEAKLKERSTSVEDIREEFKCLQGQEEEDDENDELKKEKNFPIYKIHKESVRPQNKSVLKSYCCVLTTDHLKSAEFPVRTLTAMGGLFYAGQLSAIRAPDVYGITIDGERGNRPHIYSTEEILKDSIFEVKPEKVEDLVPGTRCCAYWSDQYRCLYPGTVSEPVSPDPELDDKFVNVEFDDGDSGRINIDDIRFLPNDYPIMEYDPNPLQSLSKRKRRISGASVESYSKERKSLDSLSNSDKTENDTNTSTIAKSTTEETDPTVTSETISVLSSDTDRKHLKKKKRDKLKRLESLSLDCKKKKHKKHKCSDEHRHHRHHKKHRKHKHKHGKRHENTEIGKFNAKEKETGSEPDKIKSHKVLKRQMKRKCKSEKSCDTKQTGSSGSAKPKKCKERTDSVESRSKMAAFLPARQLWGWSGKGFKRPGAKGRARKEFYKTIQRGKERIAVGDCAVFLSTGRPDRPYIGRIESMWESWGTNMIVRVKWFYHPEETVGCPATLEYPGALFESPHVDENDVQTISHKCEVLPLKEYTIRLGNSPHRYETVYDSNDIYYLAGYYDPTNTTLKMEPGVR